MLGQEVLDCWEAKLKSLESGKFAKDRREVTPDSAEDYLRLRVDDAHIE